MALIGSRNIILVYGKVQCTVISLSALLFVNGAFEEFLEKRIRMLS